MQKFYNLDCLDKEHGLPSYSDKCFDLAIVDPPYGIDQGGGKNHTRGNLAVSPVYKDFGDKESAPKEYFEELFRVSKHQIIWGANHFISKIPFDSSCWIVWDKVNSSFFADCELAWTNFKTAVRQFTFMWQGMLQENMKDKESRIHPTQKPIALYKWLIKNYAKEGYKILDTHAGSCSSLIAYEEMGLDYVAFEIDSEYYKKACERIDKYRQQLKLFPNTFET